MEQNTKDNRKIYDVCVIGGGASGLAFAAEVERLVPGISVFIVEKNISRIRRNESGYYLK